MKKTFAFLAIIFAVSLAGCTDANPYKTETQCKQSLCTQEHCYVWSSELNRCGTAEALKKEEKRLKRIAKQAETKDSAKVVLPKAKQDSLFKIEKKEKSIKKEIKALKKVADSLRTIDSISGKNLLATTYLKDKLEAEKKALENKYKALMDSVEELNLVNHKPISAVQWVEYNKRKKKNRVDYLEKKKKSIH